MHGGAYFRNFTVFFLKWPLPPPPPRQNTSCSLAREEQPERLPSYSITVKWSRFGHAEIYALVRQWTTRLIPRSKTVSSHQISILPRNQGLFISVARKLVNFEGNRVFFDCSYGSRQQVLVPFTQLLSHGRFKIVAPPFENGISTVFPGKSALGTLQMPIRFLFSVFFFS